MGVVLHVPEVAELVVGPRGGPAGPRRLHREAAHHQPDRPAAGGSPDRPGQPGRAVNPGGQELLHVAQAAARSALPQRRRPGSSRPRRRPWRAGRRIPTTFIPGGARAITSRSASTARRGGAVERLLRSPIGDRRPEGGVAVHRGRGRDRHVGPAQAMSGEFGQVVDRPGPDGHRGGPGRPEDLLQRLDERMLRMDLRTEEERVLADDTCAGGNCSGRPCRPPLRSGRQRRSRRGHRRRPRRTCRRRHGGHGFDHQESGVAGRAQGAFQVASSLQPIGLNPCNRPFPL